MKRRAVMEYFAGLDVSMEETHVCVVDRDGILKPGRQLRPRKSPPPWQKGQPLRCGDTLARTLMLLASSLKDWGQAIGKRSDSMGAVAEKLSVILHSVWPSGQPFRW